MRTAALFAAVFLAIPGVAAAENDRVSWTDLRFEHVARQGLEPSCAAASLVTILNADFGESFDEFEVWSAYVLTLSEAERANATDLGLSISDIVALAGGLGYRAFPVHIDLLDLESTDRPAIVYIERGGERSYRHFAVFAGLDGIWVNLRDPSLGNRRVRIETFMRQWKGHAVFIDRM
jgi:predicted double-glycine peptidase